MRSAILWAAAMVGTAYLLQRWGPDLGVLPDPVHVVGHLGLCGTLAALTASAVATRWGAGSAVWIATGVAVGVGAVVELAQGLALGALNVPEAAFDVGVDAVGAVAGVAVWGALEARRAAVVGATLGWVLHPLGILPVGIAGLVFATTRDAAATATWTLVSVVAIAPAVVAWLWAVRRGRASDADVTRRVERPALFVVGAAGVGAVAVAALAGGAPPRVTLAAAIAAAGAVVATAITRAGLKISGHTAIPAALGLMIATVSGRGPVLLLGPAVVLTWARVASRRHRPVEVAAAWALAGGMALVWRVGAVP